MGVFISASINSGVADDGSYTATKVPIAVIDRDQSELSESLTAYLGETAELVDVVDDSFAMQDVYKRQCQYYALRRIEQNMFPLARLAHDASHPA